MLYPFMTLPDGTQIVHSERLPDGQVCVCVERPVMRGFHSAKCMLPSYEWQEVDGFSDADIKQLTQIIEDSAHVIFRFSETGGFLNAEGF